MGGYNNSNNDDNDKRDRRFWVNVLQIAWVFIGGEMLTCAAAISYLGPRTPHAADQKQRADC